jgi:hypothetical protein
MQAKKYEESIVQRNAVLFYDYLVLQRASFVQKTKQYKQLTRVMTAVAKGNHNASRTTCL